MKTMAFFGASALAAGSIALAGTFAPAQAFTFSGGSVTGITADDIGSSFTIDFDGSVEETDVAGLTSEALFTLTGFDGLSALFDVVLTNTSSGDITGSRVSALGFDIAPDISGATVLGDFAVTVLDSAFPNQFGDIDLCVKNGQANNCQGGVGTGNDGGPLIGNSFNFDLTLAWSDEISSFDLSNFGVRYQSIDSSALGLRGDSGTGRGTPTTSVPEPAATAALGMFALVGLGMSKKKNKVSA
jgi:hypothetical protein